MNSPGDCCSIQGMQGDNESQTHADSEFFGAVTGSYWHCTSWTNFKAILATGSIHPNDGRFEPYWGAVSENSFSRRQCVVAIFDYRNPAIEVQRKRFELFSHFFTERLPVTVAIKIDPGQLEPHIIPNTEAHADWKERWIHAVEIWSRCPVPRAWFLGCLLISHTRTGGYVWVDGPAFELRPMFEQARTLLRVNKRKTERPLSLAAALARIHEIENRRRLREHRRLADAKLRLKVASSRGN